MRPRVELKIVGAGLRKVNASPPSGVRRRYGGAKTRFGIVGGTNPWQSESSESISSNTFEMGREGTPTPHIKMQKLEKKGLTK